MILKHIKEASQYPLGFDYIDLQALRIVTPRNFIIDLGYRCWVCLTKDAADPVVEAPDPSSLG
jgi:hypothetical protein